MVKNTLIVIMVLLSLTNKAQSVYLDSCIEGAYQTFEMKEQLLYQAQVTESNVSKTGKNYLPSLELNANATYQNENISIPVAVPGIEGPAVPLNFNVAQLSLKQWIYDGSMTQRTKTVQQMSGDVMTKDIEIKMQDLKTKVTQLFMGILLHDEQLNILADKKIVINARLEEVEAAVASHLLLESDLNLLQAERVKLDQQMIEVQYNRLEKIIHLSELSGLNITETSKLITPEATLSTQTDFNNRPEVQKAQAQHLLLEAQKDMTQTAYLPRIGVFADGGVGLPGYDIFKDEVAPMLKVGVNLNWMIFDWSKGKVEKQSLSLQQQLVKSQQRQIETQLRSESMVQLNQIKKADRLMENDQELLSLYASVAEAYAAQLENGTITSSEYILQLNKQHEARANLELHKLQKLISTINYNTILGE